MPAAADKQHERLHDPNAQFASLQELALRLLRSSDPHEIVSQALGWAAELGLGAAWLRVRPKATAFQIELTAGLERCGLRALQAAVFAPTEASLPGYVVARRCAVLVADTASDRRFAELSDLMQAGGCASVLAVPLLAGARCLGVALFLATACNLLDPPVVRLLELLAGQVAWGLDHVRITAELSAREAQIEQRHAGLRRAYDLVASERRTLAAVLDAVSDAVLVIDTHGMVNLGNPAVETALGIHPDLLIGHLLHQAGVPEPLVALAQQARARRGEQSGELALPDGRVFHVSIAPVQTFDGPVQGYVALLKDITYFKRLDELKSQFVATVSHDLKSPLTILSGYAELLELAGPLNDEQAGYLKRSKDSLRRLSGLVANLLDLARIEAGVEVAMRPCDLSAILAATVDSYRVVASEKKVALELALQPNLCLIWGDGTRLQQVVANLVSNALTYTPAGGLVRIWTEVFGEALTVRVQDSGIGIGAGDLAQVFDPFFRSAAAKAANSDGTGLGLAIVKRLVEEHGGVVGVESALGAGSTFWFRLPISD